MTTPDPSTFVARNPTDLIAVVPAVLGFHPQDSVVLLTFGPPGASFHARVDLPLEAGEQAEVADVLVDAVLANRVRRAAVLLYTDDVEVASEELRTVVSGHFADQAALYGFLHRLRDLGLDVVEVRQVPTSAEAPARRQKP